MKPTTSLRERNRIRTRNDILDAAAEALGQGDGSDFTVDIVLQHAGLSRGTLYSHFPGGRDEIVRAVYLREAEIVRERAVQLRQKATTIPEKISALATAFVELVAKPEGRFYGRVGSGEETVLSPLLAGVSGGTSSFFEELVRKDLEAAARDNVLAEGVQPAAAAKVLSGAMRAAGAAASHFPEHGPDLVNTIAILVEGLLVPAASRRPARGPSQSHDESDSPSALRS